ncbi:MAG: glycosyltransferase family 4 protein [Phaeodactylibacter sp.]|uniref:glycosyltransferase family 4 protein n=1 Tax=Phaeodactylibacter sp. TaxID=1940289 RepID=UPI0032EFA03F
MKKKIVLVNQHTAYLFIDITNAFAKHYEEVVLIAGVVHPLGNELDSRIKVQSIVPYNVKNTLTRILSWVVGFIQVYWFLIFKYRNHEVFLYSNPPLLAFLPFFVKRKMSHLIVDVYPDALVTSGILKSQESAIFKTWKTLNQKALKKIYSLSTITHAMAKKIQQYTDGTKVPVVNLWVDQSVGRFQVERSQNEFFKRYNLDPRKFYVVYSGNLGKGHDVELLVEVAKSMENNSKVFFIIAGEGYKKQLIKEKIHVEQLKNCLWLPYQEKEIFKHMLAGTDIGVVTIDEPNAYVSIPSKTFNLMGAGKPIVCFGKKDSELGKLVDKNKIGSIYGPTDINKCATFINRLIEEQEFYRYYSENSKSASQKYTSANAEKFVCMHLGHPPLEEKKLNTLN